MPDWQLSPEEEIFGDQPVDANDMGALVDENGMPIGQPQPFPAFPDQQQPMVRPDGTGEPTQQQLDQAFPPQPPQPSGRMPGAVPPPTQRQPAYPPPQRQPVPRSVPPADSSEPRSQAP
jgi:penicillin-binding protein 1A